jgi:ferredoxin
MNLIARTRSRDLALGARGSLMHACLVAGLPVASSCEGRGACGKCVVRILHGSEALSIKSAHESLVLSRNEMDASSRLSCQCRMEDPRIEIMITTGYW